MVAERYAKSLLIAAKENGELDKVYQDIKKLTELFKSEEELKSIIKSPAYPKNKKEELIKSLAEELELSQITKNLISLMIRKGRERFLEEMFRYFDFIYYREKGIERVTLVCASEPDQRWVDAIKTKLESAIQKKVEVEIKVKPELLAGFELEGYDWKVFASARAFIQQIEKQKPTKAAILI